MLVQTRHVAGTAYVLESRSTAEDGTDGWGWGGGDMEFVRIILVCFGGRVALWIAVMLLLVKAASPPLLLRQFPDLFDQRLTGARSSNRLGSDELRYIFRTGRVGVDSAEWARWIPRDGRRG